MDAAIDAQGSFVVCKGKKQQDISFPVKFAAAKSINCVCQDLKKNAML